MSTEQEQFDYQFSSLVDEITVKTFAEMLENGVDYTQPGQFDLIYERLWNERVETADFDREQKIKEMLKNV